MSSIVKFTPLSGAKSEAPLCYVLDIDNFRFLLDCGWDEDCDMEIIQRLQPYVPTIDAVLISHQGLEHIGALPYAFGKLGMDCPVYATLPVNQMGQLVLYDLYMSKMNDEDFDLFDLKDVDDVFTTRIQHLKYSQRLSLRGKGEGITIVPYNAGHTLGGTIWRISKDQEEFVYAVDYNHKNEKHLARCELERIRRPSLLITDAFNALVQKGPTRKESETKIKRLIIDTVRKDGSVLIPVDTAARVLELLLWLNEVWNTENLHAYHLVWINQFADTIHTYAKSTLEWMSTEMMNAAINSRGNPFDIIYDGVHKDRHVHTLMSAEDLYLLGPGPKVVLTTFPAMEVGTSRHLFVDWANDPSNLVIFTKRGTPGTLAHQVLHERPKSINLTLKKKIPLVGEELAEFLRKRKEERQREKERLRKEEEARMNAEGEASDESDTEEVIVDPKLLHRHDIPMDTSESASTDFFKHSVKFPTFPCVETRAKADDYGLLINPDDYALPVDRDEAESAMDEDKPTNEELEEAEDKERAKQCVVEELDVAIKCQIDFVDFDGRTDLVSMLNLLSEVNARQIVLVHGSEEATQKMQGILEAKPDEYGKVVVPSHSDTVTVTSDINIYLVKLTDKLLSHVPMTQYQFGDRTYELGWCQGAITMRGTGSAQQVPVLDAVPKDTEPQPHKPFFVGEVNMQDLPRVLGSMGFRTEFVGKVLVCDDVVAVSKGADGQISVQGPLCEKYFKIREAIYSLYALV